jgi:hypothetical protein
MLSSEQQLAYSVLCLIDQTPKRCLNAALNIYSSRLCFQPFNHNLDTEETFMSHSVPVSLCALFTPLQHSIHYSNATKHTASRT